MSRYRQPLEEGLSLAVYDGEDPIFTHRGHWLHPLFALEEFLKTYEGPRDLLSVHDSAAGKAAAVLQRRLGVRRAHIDLVSDPAVEYYRGNGIEVSWEKKIEKLACQTENLLKKIDDEDEIYRILKRRANLVRGVRVEVTEIGFSYPNSEPLFENLSFSLPEGGRLIIQGDNGMGKTTLINLLLGRLVPTSGTIGIDGRKPGELPPRTIGYIKQQQTQEQFPVSAREVVAMAVDPNLSRERQAWEIDTALRRTASAHLGSRNFFSLSGGERQRVSLARTLCQKARLLLLDEPTSFLDAKSRTTLVGLLHSLTLAEMPTIIIVTHDKELEEELGWEILRLGGDHE
ncbi:MAG: DUF1893 domain-containing protein [Spirochaetales bacterium]|nr:DUF1893 domain-containing protein [Spirochaetales bacterium]